MGAEDERGRRMRRGKERRGKKRKGQKAGRIWGEGLRDRKGEAERCFLLSCPPSSY